MFSGRNTAVVVQRVIGNKANNSNIDSAPWSYLNLTSCEVDECWDAESNLSLGLLPLLGSSYPSEFLQTHSHMDCILGFHWIGETKVYEVGRHVLQEAAEV